MTLEREPTLRSAPATEAGALTPGSALATEVSALLRGRQFLAKHGISLVSRLVSVNVVPVPQKDGAMTLKVSLRPYGLSEGTPEDVVAGARRGYEAGLRDLAPRVRAAAQMALTRLDSARVQARALEG